MSQLVSQSDKKIQRSLFKVYAKIDQFKGTEKNAVKEFMFSCFFIYFISLIYLCIYFILLFLGGARIIRRLSGLMREEVGSLSLGVGLPLLLFKEVGES